VPKLDLTRFDNLNKEFEAVAQLAKDYRRISMTPIVDDDYPEVRHDYESAMDGLKAALQVNRPYWFAVQAPPAGKDLTFKQVAHISLARCNRWHPGGVKSWSLSDWYAALAGEVGELLEAAYAVAARCGKVGDLVKKLNRVRDQMTGNKVEPAALREAMASEVADVYLYLDLFCIAAGIDIEVAVRTKFNEVSERVGFPERL
jgi:NTP pyrophosphatase (non-canonical NTP hydrolase)